jgi:ArsR family transcriptional regulator
MVAFIKEGDHLVCVMIIIFKFLNIYYNIFQFMNILDDNRADQVSELLETIGKPTRLRILIAIGQGEACVCHLEALLGLRQSYISQHLMALRSAGVLNARREGRFVYYRLDDRCILELIEGAAKITGIPSPDLKSERQLPEGVLCSCPKCAAEALVDLQDVGTL